MYSFSVVQFANISLVLANEYIFDGDFWTVVLSLASIFGYISMLVVSLINIYGLEDTEEDKVREMNNEKDNKINENVVKSLNSKNYHGLFKSLSKRDWMIMGIITVVYAVIAFVNLGNNYSPETMWKAERPDQEIIVDFGQDVEIDRVLFFRTLATNGAYMSVEYALDGEEDNYHLGNFFVVGKGTDYADESGEEKKEFMESEFILGDEPVEYDFSTSHDTLKWVQLNCETTARYVRIKMCRSSMWISELGFMDPDRNVIPIDKVQFVNADENAEDGPAMIFDEQDMVPEFMTYMNSSYFDEIYHARTAWEHLEYIEPYETTHPPLGKVIMSLGIKCLV